MRDLKVFEKKIKKAMGKRETAVVDSLMSQKPEYSLDHLVKERYPSFIDAVRDLDDALSMIFLFATLPTDDKIQNAHVKECQRLSSEFQNYVMISNSLRKTFLSIKGIYYQAEIKGQMVTWITPYAFSQDVPTDVDFRVMSTFLEFYETLLGFVNFKLYSDLNLIYPPKLDVTLDENAAGMNAYIMESTKETEIIEQLEKKDNGNAAKSKSAKDPAMKERLKSLQNKISQMDSEEATAADEDMESNEDDETTADMEKDIPVPIVPAVSSDEVVPSLDSWLSKAKEAEASKTLFSTCFFFLNREVPRYSLEFVIRAFGGQVGWDETLGAGSPFTINDPCITHHILDRPAIPEDLSSLVASREFLQPQWVYDSVNSGKLLKIASYRPGSTLPAHLSPFVTYQEGDYVPMDDESDGASSLGEDEATLMEEDAEELAHNKELEAEAAGVPSTTFEEEDKPATKNMQKAKGPKKSKKAPTEEEQTRELAKIMMSKKDKHLYNQIQFGKKKKAEAVENLRLKKKAKLQKQK